MLHLSFWCYHQKKKNPYCIVNYFRIKQTNRAWTPHLTNPETCSILYHDLVKYTCFAQMSKLKFGCTPLKFYAHLIGHGTYTAVVYSEGPWLSDFKENLFFLT